MGERREWVYWIGVECGWKERQTPMHNTAVRRMSVLQCKNSEGHQTLIALVDWTRHSMSHTAQYKYTRHMYNLHCQYNNVQLYSGTYA